LGALTLKVFSNELREWELSEGEGIDPTDSFGVNLRLSIRENQIFLAEPYDPSIPWLTDRGRLFFDGMFKQNNSSSNWENIFEQIFESIYFLDHLNFQKNKILPFIIVFENLSIETLSMLYLLEQKCSILKLKKVENYKINNDFEYLNQLNKSTQSFKLLMSKTGILLNTNSRYEGYVLNLNLRQRFLKGDFKLFVIGSSLDLTFPVKSIGSNLSIFKSIGEGTHLICQDLKKSNLPFLVLNTELLKRNDMKNFVKLLKNTNILTNIWNGVNVLQHNISSSGIFSLNNFLPITSEDLTNFFGLYFINASLDSIANYKKLTELQLINFQSFEQNNLNQKIFINQNNKKHNRLMLEKLKSKTYFNYLYLPNNLFLEDSETYINTEGRVKQLNKLINFRLDSKSNWQIVRRFYSNSKKIKFFKNKKDNNLICFKSSNLHNFKHYINFQFYSVQSLTSLSFYLNKLNKPLIKLFNNGLKNTKIKFLDTKLKPWLDDFFNNNGKDSFSYNSSVLINCSKVLKLSSTNFF